MPQFRGLQLPRMEVWRLLQTTLEETMVLILGRVFLGVRLQLASLTDRDSIKHLPPRPSHQRHSIALLICPLLVGHCRLLV